MMTTAELEAWRKEHVKVEPEEGVTVTVTLGLVSFSRFASSGDILIRQRLAIQGELGRAVTGVNTVMDMDELAEVVAVLQEYAPVED